MKEGFLESDFSIWSHPINLSQKAITESVGSTRLVCDHHQNLHIFWSQLSNQDSALFYSTDMDGTLSAPIDVLALSEPVAIRLKALVSEKDNTIHLFWVNAYIGGTLFHSYAPIGHARDARAWSLPVIIVTDTDEGAFVIDQYNVIHAVFDATKDDGHNISVQYIFSSDGGITWSSPATIFSNQLDLPSTVRASISVDARNHLHVGVTIRSQEYGQESEVGYIRSLDRGRTWEPYLLINRSGISFQGVSTIVPFSFGDTVHLTWHDPRRMHQWSYDGGDTWSQPVEIEPLVAAFGGENHLVMDSAGQIHVVLAEGGGVYSATWDGREWGEIQQIDDRFIDPHGQHIVDCQGNRLHVIYYDRTGSRSAWYSSRIVNAPHFEREFVGTSSTNEEFFGNEISDEALQIEEVETESGQFKLSSSVSSQEKQIPFQPFTAAVASAVFIILVILGVNHSRSS